MNDKCCGGGDESFAPLFAGHVKEVVGLGVALIQGTTKDFFKQRGVNTEEGISGTQVMGVVKIVCAIVGPVCSMITAGKLTIDHFNQELKAQKLI